MVMATQTANLRDGFFPIRLAASVLAVTALSIVILGAVAYRVRAGVDRELRFFQRGVPPTSDEAIAVCPVEYALRTTDKNDVIFLGDSTCHTGADPRVFERNDRPGRLQPGQPSRSGGVGLRHHAQGATCCIIRSRGPLCSVFRRRASRTRLPASAVRSRRRLSPTTGPKWPRSCRRSSGFRTSASEVCGPSGNRRSSIDCRARTCVMFRSRGSKRRRRTTRCSAKRSPAGASSACPAGTGRPRDLGAEATSSFARNGERASNALRKSARRRA